MTGSVVDMAPFWAWIAAPALAATLAAAGYLWAAWKWPALRTPVAAFRVRRLIKASEPDWSKVKLDVKKCTAWAWVNLDDDGTPLTMHGERMIEVAPGRWEDPLIATAMKFIEEHDPGDTGAGDLDDWNPDGARP